MFPAMLVPWPLALGSSEVKGGHRGHILRRHERGHRGHVRSSLWACPLSSMFSTAQYLCCCPLVPEEAEGATS